ncbi:hypothetical protein EON62_03775 [archaeon]|nr:MAG: hypothetical protein EON62_03775 [archaeon]
MIKHRVAREIRGVEGKSCTMAMAGSYFSVALVDATSAAKPTPGQAVAAITRAFNNLMATEVRGGWARAHARAHTHVGWRPRPPLPHALASLITCRALHAMCARRVCSN